MGSATDSFTRANSSTIGTTETGSLTWGTSGTGTWAISSNRVAASSASTVTGADLTVDPGVTDVTVSITFAQYGGVGCLPGLVARANTTTDAALVFEADHNAVEYILYRRESGGTGSFTELGRSSGRAPATGDTLQMVLSGTSVVCKVNGTTVVSTTYSGVTGTRCGMWMYGNPTSGTQLFDDFSVTWAGSDYTERFAPDAILAQTGLTGTVSAIQDDPDSPDGNWLVG